MAIKMPKRQKAPPNPQGQMTLMDHIAELRTRMLRAAYAVAIATVVAWFLYQRILDFLIGPLKQLAPPEADLQETLVTLDPLEPFAVRIQITLYVAVMLAMPVILWQVWRFISPGLYSNERRYAAWFVACGTALFALGASLAFWTVPKALEFLAEVGGDNFTQLYGPAKYLRLVIYMMLAFGIGFEFPILLVFLQMAGILNVAQLRAARRYAIVIIAVLVAVITPSADPVSMLALCIPMWVFYEAAIVFGMVRERRLAKRDAE